MQFDLQFVGKLQDRTGMMCPTIVHKIYVFSKLFEEPICPILGSKERGPPSNEMTLMATLNADPISLLAVGRWFSPALRIPEPFPELTASK